MRYGQTHLFSGTRGFCTPKDRRINNCHNFCTVTVALSDRYWDCLFVNEGVQGWVCCITDDAIRSSKVRCGRFGRRFRRRISAALRRWNRRDWAVAAQDILPRFWDVHGGRSNGEPTNSGGYRWIRRRDGCGGQVAAEKKKVEAEPELARNLKAVLEVRTAGDPDQPNVLWTDLSPREIAETVTAQGTPVSPPVVQRWMEDSRRAGIATPD